MLRLLTHLFLLNLDENENSPEFTNQEDFQQPVLHP